MKANTKKMFAVGIVCCGVTVFSCFGALASPVRIAVRPGDSLVAVRDRVRALSAGEKARGVEIVLADGFYFIDRSLELSAADSGAAGHPVVWRAQTRGGVKFTGGIPLPKLSPLSKDDPNAARIQQEVRRRVLVADLKAAGITDYGEVKGNGVGGPYMELVWGGAYQTLARWPNEGYTGIAFAKDHGRDANGKRIRQTEFVYADPRIDRWADEPAPYGSGFFYYNWAADRVAFASIDPKTRLIKQKGRGSAYGYSKKGFWFGYNLLCELDEPGEYYIDRERGRLYVIPPDGSMGSDAALTMTSDLIVLRDASNVSFDGMVLENCRGMAFSAVGGERVELVACTIRNVGGCAVNLDGCESSRVAGCDISYCGAGGIRLNGGDARTLRHGNIVVENCHIHHYAIWELTYTPAVHLSGASSCGLSVRNCTIHDGPHVAVLFKGREHEISRNEIHSVCLESGEMGAIYAGADWTLCGNRVEANYIHDIYAPRDQPNRGVMLDDGCAGIAVTSNRFVRVGEGVSLSGIGNAVDNNLFVSNFPPITGWQAWEKPEDFSRPHYTHERLLKSFAEVPVHEEPWKSKYPYLAMIDDSMKKGRVRHPDSRTSIRHNIYVGGTTNLVSYYKYSFGSGSTPVAWREEDNSNDWHNPPKGFAPLPPLSKIGVYKSSERATWPISHPVTIKCSNLVYKKERH